VTTTLAIPCGEDSSLYLLRREEGRWQLQIAVESDGYTKISGAQGNLRYAASPRDASGEWFAVVTRTNPWCTSNWHAIQYRVLRPAESPYEPRELFSKVAGIYLGYDDMEKLVATKTSLHLSFWDWQGLSVDLFTRARVENYEVVGQTVKRRPPIANSPEGFLNEWSDLAWPEALPWTLDTSRSVEQWHEKLEKRYSDDLQVELNFTQPCEGKESWRMGLALYEEKSKAHSTVFATV